MLVIVMCHFQVALYSFKYVCLWINHSPYKNALSYLHFIIQDLVQAFLFSEASPKHSPSQLLSPVLHCSSSESFCGI